MKAEFSRHVKGLFPNVTKLAIFANRHLMFCTLFDKLNHLEVMVSICDYCPGTIQLNPNVKTLTVHPMTAYWTRNASKSKEPLAPLKVIPMFCEHIGNERLRVNDSHFKTADELIAAVKFYKGRYGLDMDVAFPNLCKVMNTLSNVEKEKAIHEIFPSIINPNAGHINSLLNISCPLDHLKSLVQLLTPEEIAENGSTWVDTSITNYTRKNNVIFFHFIKFLVDELDISCIPQNLNTAINFKASDVINFLVESYDASLFDDVNLFSTAVEKCSVEMVEYLFSNAGEYLKKVQFDFLFPKTVKDLNADLLKGKLLSICFLTTFFK